MLFPLIALFMVNHVGKRGDFMSRMKVLQAASSTAVTSEDLWFSFSATFFLCFPLKHSTNDAPLFNSCSTYLPPCLGDT